MKKLSWVLLLALVLLLWALPAANAQAADIVASGTCGAQGDNLTWTLDSDGVLTISGTGEMAYYSSPSYVPWNSSRNSIKSVVINDGVTSVGNYAFYYCTNLTSVTIPDSVTSIGSYAFGYCSSLTSVTIPGSVTSIGDYAFHSCSSLTSVAIPACVTNIGGYAFSHCSSLTSIDIPDGVTSIGDNAFYNCTSLTSVTIPDSITSIGESAFSRCTSLTGVTIPNSVTSIGGGAFNGCTSLTGVTIPDSVTSIGDYAFSGCNSLTDIIVNQNNVEYSSRGGVLFNKEQTVILGYPAGRSGAYIIPNSVTTIGAGAFEQCISLTSVTIPDSVTSIGNQAFLLCSSMTSMTIPDSVTSIGDNAFDGCISLTIVTIPGSVTSISRHAFADCDSLTGVIIPDSVTSIGEGAFVHCDSLTSVTIGNGVTSIGRYAFEQCISLTSVTIPDSVTSIGDNAFHNCTSLTGVTIPDSVTSIGASAFGGCEALTAIFIPGGVTSIGKSTFGYCISLTSVTIPDSVTSIGNSAFHSCYHLTSVTIGNGVTSIGERAFYDCSSLSDVYYGGTREQWDAITIGDYNRPLTDADIHFLEIIGSGTCGADGDNLTWTLYDNGKLTIRGTGAMADWDSEEEEFAPWYEHRDAITSIVVDNGATSIGNDAFLGCNSLTSVSLPTSTTRIGDYAFPSGSYTFSVDFSKITYIGECAFYGCSGLTSLTLRGTVSEGAFMYCGGLQTLDLTASSYVNEYVFANCSSLASVYFSKNLSYINNGAFFGCGQLTDVYYSGSRKDFKAVTINARDNESLLNANWHFAIPSYTIRFDANNGTGTMADQDFSYGEAQRLTSNTFTRAGHTFNGWNTEADGTGTPYRDGQKVNNLTDVDETIITLYAQWTPIEYTVSFVNDDGTVLQSSSVAYGTTPVYSGTTPAKEATDQYTFTFAGWTNGTTTYGPTANLPAVTGPTTYTALFTPTIRTYTVTWKSQDGQTTLETDENVPYGTAPDYNAAEPSKQATDQFYYTWTGWATSPEQTSGTPEGELTVTGDMTYYAAFSENIQKYTVTWRSQDGQTTLETDEDVLYGTAPDFGLADPEKQADEAFSYEFVGWATSANQESGTLEADLSAVSGHITYYAAFHPIVQTYTITFKNYDGTVLQSSEVAYGETPAYSGETPTKAADTQNTYTFTGWTPAIVPVNGEATYMAAFAPVANLYAVTLEDRTNGAATISGIAAGENTCSGETAFNVTCAKACAVLYTTDGENYTRLTATAADDGYSFTVDVDQDMTILVVMKGDVNFDGKLDIQDVAMTKAAQLNKITVTPLQRQIVDVNADNKLDIQDVAMTKAAQLNKISLGWDIE